MNTLRDIIIKELEVKPNIDIEQEIQARTYFLQKHLAGTGLRGFVLGISGGQDSLLAGMLAQNAVNNLRSEGYDASFHAVLLPYGTQADRDDALLACETIRPDFIHDLDIKPGTDAFASSYQVSENAELADYHKGNVKARMRMIAQYALAGQNSLLVVGTDHAAEAVTGFFTKYGDGGADVLPLSGLTKRQGRALLQSMDVPEVFTTKAPTADLLDNKPGQTDETELATTYEKIDDYLEGKLVDDRDAEMIEKRFLQTVHKRTVPVSFQR